MLASLDANCIGGLAGTVAVAATDGRFPTRSNGKLPLVDVDVLLPWLFFKALGLKILRAVSLPVHNRSCTAIHCIALNALISAESSALTAATTQSRSHAPLLRTSIFSFPSPRFAAEHVLVTKPQENYRQLPRSSRTGRAQLRTGSNPSALPLHALAHRHPAAAPQPQSPARFPTPSFPGHRGR
ncbi:hypothetical protein VTI74DRAFT_5682 [Chaetomium olivicolor]